MCSWALMLGGRAEARVLLAPCVAGPLVCTACARACGNSVQQFYWAYGRWVPSARVFRTPTAQGYRSTVHVRTVKRYVTVRATDMWSETKVGWDGLGVLLPGVVVRVAGADFVSTN